MEIQREILELAVATQSEDFPSLSERCESIVGRLYEVQGFQYLEAFDLLDIAEGLAQASPEHTGEIAFLLAELAVRRAGIDDPLRKFASVSRRRYLDILARHHAKLASQLRAHAGSLFDSIARSRGYQ